MAGEITQRLEGLTVFPDDLDLIPAPTCTSQLSVTPVLGATMLSLVSAGMASCGTQTHMQATQHTGKPLICMM